MGLFGRSLLCLVFRCLILCSFDCNLAALFALLADNNQDREVAQKAPVPIGFRRKARSKRHNGTTCSKLTTISAFWGAKFCSKFCSNFAQISSKFRPNSVEIAPQKKAAKRAAKWLSLGHFWPNLGPKLIKFGQISPQTEPVYLAQTGKQTAFVIG